jgi:hypothetical protein
MIDEQPRKEGMSQTNYDRWRDFSNGRKSLTEYADSKP